MTRLLTIGYGAVCYVVFLAAFLYAIGFVGNIVVPNFCIPSFLYNSVVGRRKNHAVKGWV